MSVTPAGNLAFEFVVIGSGPAGQKAAIQAAKAGRRVAVIERDRHVGGSCVHTGTIPSKSLREHALRQRARQVDLMNEPIQSRARTRCPRSCSCSQRRIRSRLSVTWRNVMTDNLPLPVTPPRSAVQYASKFANYPPIG